MADKSATSLPAASALDGTETAYVVQGGNSRKTTTQEIANLAPEPQVLPDLAGNSGLFLRVNSTEDDVEWAIPSEYIRDVTTLILRDQNAVVSSFNEAPNVVREYSVAHLSLPPSGRRFVSVGFVGGRPPLIVHLDSLHVCLGLTRTTPNQFYDYGQASYKMGGASTSSTDGFRSDFSMKTLGNGTSVMGASWVAVGVDIAAINSIIDGLAAEAGKVHIIGGYTSQTGFFFGFFNTDASSAADIMFKTSVHYF